MTHIEVVAAVIHNNNKFLATQRGYGEFEGLWEFPGGKIEQEESHIEALKREIREELGIEIEVNRYLCTIEYDYPSFHLTMHTYMCEKASGNIELREHKSSCWLTIDALDSVQWLPADIDIVKRLKLL